MIVRTYLARLLARERHFGGEFLREILDARGCTPRIIVHTYGARDDAFLTVAILRPLLMFREQFALLLEELRFAEALLEADGALEGRRRARGRT